MESEELPGKYYDVPKNDEGPRRQFLIKRIEDLVRMVVVALVNREKPSFTYNDGRNSGWSNNSSGAGSSSSNSYDVVIDEPMNDPMEEDTMEEESMEIEDEVSSKKTIVFTGNKSRQRFALIMRILTHVHCNLIAYANRSEEDFYITKRSFFYRLKNEDIKRFVEKQEQVEWAIKELTMLLECGPWEIGFISTSKGLVAGDLTLYLGESKVMNYEQLSCHAVPDVIANVTRIRTNANYVLVVEKDSIFQQLLREECASFNKCILITGKGYPDIPTRMLVHLLSEVANLSVYALVDANPHGFEIMCVYRFGTLNNSGYREKLLCPKMRWLGVHQTDLIKLEIPRVRLTKRDLKKIDDLQNRNYVNADFDAHLIAMKQGKAEIESVNKKEKRYLSRFFIPIKIRMRDYI